MVFDATVSYLAQLITNKDYNIKSVCSANTRSQLAKHKVAPFMGKMECKKYLKAVWNIMSRERQMQVRKLQEQQGIKSAMRHYEAWLGVHSQPKGGDGMKEERETSTNPTWGRS